jgi:ubiquinone/menaquinone biosynthesis C-methylase UbiE
VRYLESGHDELSDGETNVSFEYFQYLERRTKLQLWLRKPFMWTLANVFKGQVLDVGSGVGEFLKTYRDSFGVDANQFCVESCRKQGLRCVNASADDLPFPEQFFDGVLISHVIEHLESPDKAISEANRVLKTGGKLCIVVPMQAGFKKDPTHLQFYDGKRLSEALSRHGFAVQTVHQFPFPWAIAGKFLYFNELRCIATKLA